MACFWSHRFEEGLRRAVFLEPLAGRRSRAAQVAVMQRLWPRDRRDGKGFVVAAVHLRASADEAFRRVAVWKKPCEMEEKGLKTQGGAWKCHFEHL